MLDSASLASKLKPTLQCAIGACWVLPCSDLEGGVWLAARLDLLAVMACCQHASAGWALHARRCKSRAAHGAKWQNHQAV